MAQNAGHANCNLTLFCLYIHLIHHLISRSINQLTFSNGSYLSTQRSLQTSQQREIKKSWSHHWPSERARDRVMSGRRMCLLPRVHIQPFVIQCLFEGLLFTSAISTQTYSSLVNCVLFTQQAYSLSTMPVHYEDIMALNSYTWRAGSRSSVQQSEPGCSPTCDQGCIDWFSATALDSIPQMHPAMKPTPGCRCVQQCLQINQARIPSPPAQVLLCGSCFHTVDVCSQLFAFGFCTGLQLFVHCLFSK